MRMFFIAPLLVAACGSSDSGVETECGPNGVCAAGFSCHAATNKCVKSGSASAGVTESSVAPDSHMVDKTSPHDGAITMDGRNDAAFDLTVTGPLSALAIITTDANGKAQYNQIWDSLTDQTPIPAAIGVSFTRGASTWQVGIFENDQLLNNADGSIPPLNGTHKLRLYCSDSGFFKSPNQFRLVAVLPDGDVAFGPVFAYPEGAL